jgi:hypothetical protein
VNALTSADGRVVDVVIGPVRPPIAVLDLRPSSSDLVDSVSVRGGAGASDAVAHVSVNTRGPVSGAVRYSKRRVYVDLQPRGSAPAPVEAAGGAPVAPASTTGTEPAAPAGSVPAAPAAAAASGATSGEEWERALVDRAREFAKMPDVRAIQRLRAELLVRRGRPADDPPIAAPGDKTMTEIIGYLEVAQKLQLAMDARLLREAQEKSAR